MVSVANKTPTLRTATATARILVNATAYALLQPASIEQNKKGDVLTVAQLAGIMGAKQTATLIPLCHPLPLTHVDVGLTLEGREDGSGCVLVSATVQTEGKTGVGKLFGFAACSASD